MTRAAGAWRKKLAFVAKASISALLIAFLLTRVDVSGVTKSLATASWLLLALGLLALTVSPPLGGVRWWIALRGMGTKAKLSDTIFVFWAALIFGQVLPSVAGDGLRVWLASRRGYTMRASLQSVLIERVSMVLSLLALALATSPWLVEIAGDRTPIWICAALFAAGIAGCSLLLTADRAPSFLMRLNAWQALAYAAAPARRLMTSKWGALLFVVGIISNLNFTLAAYLVGLALDVRASAWDFLAIMPTVTLATTLPISFGGWGVREGVLVFLLGKVGVPGAEALSLSLLFGAFGMISGLPGLLAWAVESRDRISDGSDAIALGLPRADG